MRKKKIFVFIFAIFAFIFIVASLFIYFQSKEKIIENGREVVFDYINTRYNNVNNENISVRLGELVSYYSESYKDSNSYLDDTHMIEEYFSEGEYVCSIISVEVICINYESDYLMYEVNALTYYYSNADKNSSHYLQYNYTIVVDADGKIDNVIRNDYSYEYLYPHETNDGEC